MKSIETFKRMAVIFILGFSSGLPFLLTSNTFKQWMANDNIDVKTIGYFSWVGLAYSLKFLWAPLLDRYALSKLGRRKSWMLVSQIGIILFLFLISEFQPNQSLLTMVFLAVAIATLSATQDIAIDAYRREYLKDEELGLGSTITTWGYRIAMLFSGGIAIGLVDPTSLNLSWSQVYKLMGLLMLIGPITIFFIKEPHVEAHPKTMKEAIISPFQEFFSRGKYAWLFLAFVILFKLGDSISGSVLNKYYTEMQYTNADIGFIAKTVGMFSVLAGYFIGGVLLLKFPLTASLIIFGVLQACSTAYFAILQIIGEPNLRVFASAIVFEDFTGGMGSAAFLAFLATITNKKFSATQYALLSSLATVGRNFFSGFSGELVVRLGWTNFFYFCALIAIPGIIMAIWFSKKKEGLAT